MSTDTGTGDDADRQSDLAVMDANEYKQKRRLQRILDAQDHVETVASRAYERYTAGEITEEAKNIVLLRAVKQFIRECYNLLLEYDRELEDGAWNRYLDGPPVNDDRERLGDPLGAIERRGGATIYFWGLADVLTAETFYEDRWVETVESRHGPDEQEEFSETYTVPEDVIWNGYLLLRRFVSEEKDMEIRFEDMDDSLPTWGFSEIDDEADGEVEVV